jgi:integrase/DNA-binding Xre family transcriptional regulator
MQGETMARRTRVYGHACYNWAMKRGLVPSNPFALVSVEGGDVKRDRVLTDDEAGEVWRAAGQLGWPWGPYFRLLLLTLQREVETAGMQWSELAPDRTSWTMPGARTKNGKAHLVHLAEPARAILASMPRRAGSDLVFTTTGKTPVSGFGNAKERLVAKILEERAAWAAALGAEPAALVPWRIHDFRRTGVTALAGLGTRWEVADRLLNHVTGAISGIAAIYQRHEFLDERRAAMEQWAAHVLAIAKAGEDRHQAELAAPRTAATSMGQTIVGAVAGADGAPNHATDELQQMQGAEARAPIAVSELLPGHFMDRLLAGDSPVRVWRMHRGMNGRQLAEAAGISASYLSEIENSRKPCSSAALLAIATVLRVRVQTLLG